MNARAEIALMRFIEENIHQPFIWGRRDCNTFVLEALDACAGTSHLASKIIGKYSTALGAMRYRLRSPWGNLYNLLQDAGCIEIQEGFQQIGDIMVVPDHRWEQAHICLGITVASVDFVLGVHIYPIAQLRRPCSVWRLPCLLQ